MGNSTLLGHAAQQQDGFSQDEFSHRPGVGKWCVEHSNPALASSLQINLVGAYAEATHSNQF